MLYHLEIEICRVVSKRQLIEIKKELRKGECPAQLQDIPLFAHLL